MIKLGLFDTIDNRFDEWLNYEKPLKFAFISSDIETYGRFKYDKPIDRAEMENFPKFDLLIQDFEENRSDKERMKEIYLKYIDKICSPKLEIVAKNKKETEQNYTQNYSSKDEYDFVADIEEKENELIAETIKIEADLEQLQVLTIETQLSIVEKAALEFIKSERKEREKILELFSPAGIMQIANRAAYKLYFQSRKATNQQNKVVS